MRILIVTGMPGAGKEELLSVARGMGIPFLRMGDLVREGYSGSGLSDSMSLGEYANQQRQEFGKDIWARRAIERMSGEVFLVDGCRSLDEVESFRGLSDDVVVVAVHAPRAQRYSRLVARGRNDAPADMDEFDVRDRREMGWGISDTIALADVMIVNDSDLETFRERVTKALEVLV
jgi:dephospho-CoA kinase